MALYEKDFNKLEELSISKQEIGECINNGILPHNPACVNTKIEFTMQSILNQWPPDHFE